MKKMSENTRICSPANKKILMLSFRPPVPLTEGFKLRAYNTAKILSSRYEVDLLTLSMKDAGISHSDKVKLSKLFGKVKVFESTTLISKAKSITALPFPDIPLQTRYYLHKNAKEWVENQREDYELLYCLHLRMAPYMENIPGIKVIDLIDATSVMYEGARKRATGVWKIIYSIETRRLKKYERQIFRLFDKLFISSKFDKERIAVPDGLNSKCKVLPNGVRNHLLQNWNEYKNLEEENWLFFIGKMDYAPNVDAVKYFVKNVWPAIRNAYSNNLEFIIAGTSPRPEISRLGDVPGVRVTGHLEDPYRLMAKSKIVVVPLRYSAGIQNKVLEAMALGKPVVTTPPGFRGIDAVAGKDLIVSEIGEFVREISKLLSNQQKRLRIAKRARRAVSSKYTWGRVKRILLSEIDDLL